LHAKRHLARGFYQWCSDASWIEVIPNPKAHHATIVRSIFPQAREALRGHLFMAMFGQEGLI